MKRLNSNQVLTNTLYSFLGYSLPLVFAIVVTPVLVRRLGTHQYGIYILANTIMGFLNLADLGVGQATLKYFSERYGQEDPVGAGRIFAAGNFLFWVIGLLGVAIFTLIGLFFLPWFKISPDNIRNVQIIFLLSGAVFLITSLMVIQGNALKAIQRYDITVKVSLFYIALFNISALILILAGFQLKALVAANAVSALLAFFLLSFFVKKYYPGTSRWAVAYYGSEIRKFYRFGGAVFVTNIANNMLAQFDRLLIPVYRDPAQLAYYSIPGSVAEKINGVAGTSTGFLFPMLASLLSAGEMEKAKAAYERVMRNVIVIVSALVLMASLLSAPILRYWVGESYAKAGSGILIILCLTNGVLAVYSILQNVLLGIGKVRFLMKQSLVMAVLNVGLLVWLLPVYGIKGAAWAYFISVLPALGSVLWAEKHFFGFSGRMVFYCQQILRLGLVAAVVSLLYFVVLRNFLNNLFTLLLCAGMLFGSFIGLYALLGFFPPEDLTSFKEFVVTIKNKFTRNQ